MATKKTKQVYLTPGQAEEIQIKLQSHIDDLMRDIKYNVIAYLTDIVLNYLPEDEQKIFFDEFSKQSQQIDL